LVDQIAIWCKSASEAVKADVLYGPIVFYERIRLMDAWRKRRNISLPRLLSEVKPNCFFFEGIPQCVEIANMASPHTSPSCCALHGYGPIRAIAERFVHIQKICSLDSKNYDKLSLRAQRVSGVSSIVPAAPRVFLYELRKLFATLRAHKDPSWFVTCENGACARLFMRNCLINADGTPDLKRPALSLADQFDYWELIEPAGSNLHDEARFCCSVCAKQWWRECQPYATVATRFHHSPRPQLTNTAWLAFDGRRARYAYAELQRALRRNKGICVDIHRLHRYRCAHAPCVIHTVDHDCILSTFITRANVDVGILYMEWLVATCVSLRRQATVLSMRELIIRVRNIYAQHPLSTLITSTSIAPPAFLKQLRSNVDVIALR
jgi:hypothetical protein